MEGGEGMVAVVRGLRDAGLAVTLLDGTRQYTLMPNAVSHHTSMPTHVHITRNCAPAQHCAASTDVTSEPPVRCDSAAQATDGRYASVYKMAHCNVTPTSPPMLVTEFPPQRAEVCPGHGNFEVGGAGSGDTCSPTRGSSSFRGGMSWPDRGSVCIPRPSHGPDTFANSLRRYPSVSPERSSEMVERLINYTQTKSTTKRSQTSPTRISESNSAANMQRNSLRNTTISKASQRICEPEVCVKPKIRIDESPTRDGRPKRSFECDGVECRRTVFGRNYDVRYLKDVSKRFKESMRNVSTYPYSQPVCPNIKERYDHLPPEQRKLPEQNSTNSVNMEIQAAVKMISREVSTLPRSEPSRRNVAVPLSPTSSTAERTEGERNPNLNAKLLFKSVQTTFSPIDLTAQLGKTIQTTSSSIELLSIDHKRRCSDHSCRRSRSQEELKAGQDKVQEGIVHLLENLIFCDNDRANKMLRDELLKKYKNRIKEKVNFKTDAKSPILSQNYHFLHHEHYNKTIQVYRAEVSPFRTAKEENNLNVVIRLWLKSVQIRNRDFLGRPIDRQQVINTVTNRIKSLIENVGEQYVLKTKIIELLEEVPINTNECSKTVYLTGLANELVTKINIHESNGKKNHSRVTVYNNNVDQNKGRGALKLSNYIQPTVEEIKEFVKDELTEFLEKSQLKICSNLIEDLGLELVDLLIDSIKDLFTNNVRQTKEEIVILSREIAGLSEHQAMYFAKVLLEHLKEYISIFNESNMPAGRIERSQTFVVLQNSSQNASKLNETSDFSIRGISEADIEANLDLYVRRLTQEIDEWINNIPGVNESNYGFRQVVVNDLAGDIVDRHKYLEMNPSKWVSDEAEIEHLKCQIFKWINKLIDEDSILDALEHATELFKRVQNIPRPMLMRPHEQEPGYTLKTNMPPCCAIQSTSQSQHQNLSGQRVMPPNSFSGNKTGFDANKMPTFGPAGPGGSMSEAPRRNVFSERRQSSPGAYASRPMPQHTRNITSSNMPIFGPAGPGGSMVEPQRSSFTYRRLSGPGAIASGPMQTGTNVSQMPVYYPSVPGGSMSETANNKPQNISLSRPAGVSSEPMNIREKINVKQLPTFGTRGPGGSIDGWTPQPSSSKRLSVPAYLGSAVQRPLSVDQLNAEYDNFVKNWLKEIPISVSNAQEQELADKVRLGIYNGIWKTIAKLELEPIKLLNPFYCQDVLDDDVDELLNCLPQSQELINKKNYLKSKLVQKTGDIIELKVSAMLPDNYKQQLLQNVTNNLPKRTKVDLQGEDPVKLYEDIEKLSLVEEFILLKKFKGEDKVKAEVYRKKLANHIEELVQNIKQSQGKDLNKISPDIYVKDVLNALQSVHMPSENTIREEANEILLGLEIERWFSDLPVVENNEFLEKISRRRLRYALAKKIRDIEKTMNLADSSTEIQLKQEITRFLHRLPMQTGENINVEFIVDELVNRIKNRPKEQEPTRRNPVEFQEAGYGAFVQNIPLTSSYADLTPELSDRSSYMILEGSKYHGDSHRYGGGKYLQMGGADDESEEKFYTLEETRGHLKNPGRSVIMANKSQLLGSRDPQNIQNQSVEQSIQSQAGLPHVSFKEASGRGGQPSGIVPYTEHAQGSLQARVGAVEMHVPNVLPNRASGSPQQHIGPILGIQPIPGPSQVILPQDSRIQKGNVGNIQLDGQPSQDVSHRARQSCRATPVNNGPAIGNVEPPLNSIQAMVRAMDQARAANFSEGARNLQNQIDPSVGSGQAGIIPIIPDHAGQFGGAGQCRVPNTDQAGASGGAGQCVAPYINQAGPSDGAAQFKAQSIGQVRPFSGSGPCGVPNIDLAGPTDGAGQCVAPNIGQAGPFGGTGPCEALNTNQAVPSVGPNQYMAPHASLPGTLSKAGPCVVPSNAQAQLSSGAILNVVPNIGQIDPPRAAGPCPAVNVGQAGPSGTIGACVVPNIGGAGPSVQAMPCGQPNIRPQVQPIPRIQQLPGGVILGTNQIPGPGSQPGSGGQQRFIEYRYNQPVLSEFKRPPALGISYSTSQIQEQNQQPVPPPQQAPEIHRSMAQEAVQPASEPNRFIHAPATAGHLSILNQQPVGYSTPQPATSQGAQREPPRLARIRTRAGERPRRDIPRRRLELEDTDEEMERDRDEVQCRCMERVYRCRRRRPACCDSDEFLMNCSRYFSMRYPFPYFF